MKSKIVKQSFKPFASLLDSEVQQQVIFLSLLQLCSKLSSELEKPVDEILFSFRLFNVSFPCEETDEHDVYDKIKEYKRSIKSAYDKAVQEWGLS